MSTPFFIAHSNFDQQGISYQDLELFPRNLYISVDEKKPPTSRLRVFLL